MTSTQNAKAPKFTRQTITKRLRTAGFKPYSTSASGQVRGWRTASAGFELDDTTAGQITLTYRGDRRFNETDRVSRISLLGYFADTLTEAGYQADVDEDALRVIITTAEATR